MTTPIRSALVATSHLLPLVEDGLQALRRADTALLHEEVRKTFKDSVDIDAAFEEGHEQENRWDYLLGHAPSRAIIGLEPHTANNREVAVVIMKLSRRWTKRSRGSARTESSLSVATCSPSRSHQRPSLAQAREGRRPARANESPLRQDGPLHGALRQPLGYQDHGAHCGARARPAARGSPVRVLTAGSTPAMNPPPPAMKVD